MVAAGVTGGAGRGAVRQAPLRALLRYALAAFLALAGVLHFVRPDEFLAQVPAWLPAPAAIVAVSGALELALAVALVALPRRRAQVALAVAVFFLLVLPGNVAQWWEGTDAFGLDSDGERLTRLLLHPLLWLWAAVAGDLWPRPRRRPDASVRRRR